MLSKNFPGDSPIYVGSSLFIVIIFTFLGSWLVVMTTDILLFQDGVDGGVRAITPVFVGTTLLWVILYILKVTNPTLSRVLAREALDNGKIAVFTTEDASAIVLDIAKAIPDRLFTAHGIQCYQWEDKRKFCAVGLGSVPFLDVRSDPETWPSESKLMLLIMKEHVFVSQYAISYSLFSRSGQSVTRGGFSKKHRVENCQDKIVDQIVSDIVEGLINNVNISIKAENTGTIIFPPDKRTSTRKPRVKNEVEVGTGGN